MSFCALVLCVRIWRLFRDISCYVYVDGVGFSVVNKFPSNLVRCMTEKCMVFADLWEASFLCPRWWYGMVFGLWNRHAFSELVLNGCWISLYLNWFLNFICISATCCFEQIVDFCCGSNDFSWLMKEKLDQIGKTCRYKNYDIFPAKVSSVELQFWS